MIMLSSLNVIYGFAETKVRLTQTNEICHCNCLGDNYNTYFNCILNCIKKLNK